MERNEGLVEILTSSLSSRRNSGSGSTSRPDPSTVLWPFNTGLEPEITSRRQPPTTRQWCLRVLDFIVGFTIFPVAVTICWRGIWQFVDFAFTNLSNSSNIDDFPKEKWSSVWLTLPVCLVLSFFQNAFQFHCSSYLKNWYGIGGRRKDVVLWFILKLTILISLILGVTCWRGFWDLWDLMLYKTNAINPDKPNFQLAVIFFVLLNSFILVCWPLQVSRSLLSSPLQVSPDGGIEDIFESPTLFNKKPPALLSRSYGALDNRAWNWYFFDIFASTFLVQFLAVTSWWGLWTLEDKVLGVCNTTKLLFVYMCIGYSFCFLAYTLQFTVTKDVPTLRQKCWSELVVSIGFIGVVSVWKGIWDYSDPLLYSWLGIEDRCFSLFVQAFMAYMVLLIFNNTSLASNRGVVLDCPETIEARSENLFVLDHFVNCCGQMQKPISILTFSHNGEDHPLLE